MKTYNLLFFLILIFIFSCHEKTEKKIKNDVFSNYLLITTAIKMSKESRLNFQNKFSIALDSFYVNDNPNIKTEGLDSLLEIAKTENLRAKMMLNGVNEIDDKLLYKAQTFDMLKAFDSIYEHSFRDIIKIMNSKMINKKDSIRIILSPAYDIMKQKGTQVIETANLVADKYKI